MSTRLRRALGTTAMLLVLALVGWRLWPRTEAPAEAAAPRADADGSLRLAPSQVTGLGIALGRTAAAASVPLPGLAAQAQAPMDASQQVASPWPGTVVALLAEEGARLEKGAAILTLEVMKMEQTLRAPFAGVLRKLKCKVGDIVGEGVELAEVEPAA